ncbi:MAG TPA: stress response translation initiation inhibitor YciH [Spirochaetota bacterium]|nr:stress response translation initiation inhibitor YciH [Spirochaetota bacterium]
MKNEKDVVFSFTLDDGLKSHNSDKKDDIIKIRLEKNSRGGKNVSVIFNLPSSLDINDICSQLKKKCGTGGTVKEGKIEIQGDKRDLIEKFFLEKNLKIKRAGG